MRRLRSALLAALAGLAVLGARPAQAQPEDAVAPQRILVLLAAAPQHFRPGADYGGGYGDALVRSARERLARRIARQHGLSLVTDWPMPLLGLDCFVMAVPAGTSSQDAADRVARDPGVAFTQPMHLFHGQAAAPAARGDPLFAAQPAARLWHLADLHRIATGRGVTVALIDSGVETAHPDLAGQLAGSADFVADRPRPGGEQHGTAIAGVIAAKADNGVGIVGVAPGARLLALRACWQVAARPPPGTTVCDSLSLAKALHYAITRNAQVINLSLSGPPDPLLGRLLDVGLGRGAIMVSAYDPAEADGGFPASHPGVVAVGDEAAALPRGVYGAPGRDILTTQPGGRWSLVSGSSYAAAHVSGLIALLRERKLPARVAPVLVSDAGGGPIDACATLMRGKVPCDCTCGAASHSASARR